MFWIGIAGIVLFTLCGAGLLFVLAIFGLASAYAPDVNEIDVANAKYSEVTVEGSGSQKIALISIEGVISSRPVQQMFYKTPSMVKTVTAQLEQASSDDDVQAIILEINSPGGGMTASDVLHNEIQKFKKDSGKKVIAFMKDVAASGGYYTAVCGDKIMAHPTTVTGSIGVIMMMLNLEDFLKWIHVSEKVIKSGPHKDMGSSTRKMTEKEEALFQEIIDEMYDRFVEVVAEGRSMDKEKVRTLADGRWYTGKQALEHGLIDSLGYFDDAVELAKQEAGLTSAKVIRYRRKVGLSELILSVAAAGAGPRALVDTEALTRRQTPSFMYMWAPGEGQGR
jgi:protease-4